MLINTKLINSNNEITKRRTYKTIYVKTMSLVHNNTCHMSFICFLKCISQVFRLVSDMPLLHVIVYVTYSI